MAFVAPPLPVVMLKLFPHVQSIVDESQALLQGATYSVSTGSEVIVGPGASVAAASQAGIDLPPGMGEYQLVLSAAMFVDLVIAVSMRAASDSRKRQSFRMVPADNQGRAVLRWHTTPIQLDFYVVPIATGIGGFPRPASSDTADDLQGDLRWRLFRAAGELKSVITSCSLTLVPPSIKEPLSDFVNIEFFLSPYIQIIGHLRTQWEWEAICTIRELPIPNPYERCGNWETAYGKRILRCCRLVCVCVCMCLVVLLCLGCFLFSRNLAVLLVNSPKIYPH